MKAQSLGFGWQGLSPSWDSAKALHLTVPLHSSDIFAHAWMKEQQLQSSSWVTFSMANYLLTTAAGKCGHRGPGLGTVEDHSYIMLYSSRI